MGAFAAGSVVLVPFPFSDLSQSKRRPAVVLADAGRGDEHLVAGRPVHDFRVAGHKQNSRFARCRRHRAGDPAQGLDRHALFDDRGARQIERGRPADREIVDGAADGQPADVAAVEEQGLHHVAVGGQGEAGPES